MSTDESEPVLIDKCRVCETFFVVATQWDLQRRLNSHELASHGKVQPNRTDHSETDYR